LFFLERLYTLDSDLFNLLETNFTMQQNILKNLNVIKNNILKICKKINRNPKEINIVAVSKEQPIEKIEELLHNKHYCFGESTVLFKPTKCAQQQFRPTKAEATSYFIAGDDRACAEDKGFAINPWTRVRFENTGFILEENRALAMGNYFFTDLDGNEAKVEYTFGYQLINGSLKIDLHHSSFPYNP